MAEPDAGDVANVCGARWPLIDWSMPWLQPYRCTGTRITQQLVAGVPLCTALNDALQLLQASGHPLRRFVEQSALPAGEAYEAFIARTGSVPTRNNAHDFFNALVWLQHPQLKARLNALQAAHIDLDTVAARRGAVRDALTLFDENAAWLQAPPPLVNALQRRDWHALFVTHRTRWAEARLTLFGHALLDKLQQPRKPITAHVWLVPSNADDPQHWLATALTPQHLACKPWLPLPVLGVPGWWNLNQQAGFYDDATVFRPQREPLKIAAASAISSPATAAYL